MTSAFRSQLAGRLLAGAIIAAVPGRLAAQTPVSARDGQAVVKEIGSTPTCRQCTVLMEQVVSFGEWDGPGIIADRPYAIRRDSRGRYYTVGAQSVDRVPAVYDSTGAFVQRLGRVGRGPGEFGGARTLLVRDDSLFIFDTGNRRLTVLSPSYEPVRSTPIPWVDGAAFAGEDIVLNAPTPTGTGTMLALQRLDRTDHHLVPFGDTIREPARGEPSPLFRLASNRGDGVWSVRADKRYVLRRWSVDGTKTMELHRDAAWYEPYDRAWAPTPDRPPAPSITTIWEAPNGLLWVIGITADRHWAEGLGKPVRMEGRMVYPVIDDARVFDTIVEVIDPQVGALVTSARFDIVIELTLGDGLFSSLGTDENGAPRVTVWRMRLAPPGTSHGNTSG